MVEIYSGIYFGGEKKTPISLAKGENDQGPSGGIIPQGDEDNTEEFSKEDYVYRNP